MKEKEKVSLNSRIYGKVQIEIEGIGKVEIKGYGQTLELLCIETYVAITGKYFIDNNICTSENFQLISFDGENFHFVVRKL